MWRTGVTPVLVTLTACAAALAFGAPLASADNAGRARLAYQTMERTYFDPRMGDYREAAGKPAAARAWPLSQALAATLEVAPLERTPAFMNRVLRAQFALLDQRFRTGELYTSTPHGHVYYDDNEWIALDLLDWNGLHTSRTTVRKALRVFDGVAAAWSSDITLTCPGGVPWTDTPGIHDRNTVSTANAAVLGLRLYLISRQAFLLQWSTRMLDWLDQCLLAPDGMFWDHLDPDGTIDQTEWSYNQSSVFEAYRLLYLASGDPADLERAEAIADATLAAFSSRWANEPPEFAAIFFCRLLRLATLDRRLDYVAAAQTYADQLWSQPHTNLLAQAAAVRMYGALARAQRPDLASRAARQHRRRLTGFVVRRIVTGERLVQVR